MLTLTHIHRYPIKGLSLQSLESVGLSTGAGLPRDRLFAFAHGKSAFDQANPEKMHKSNYLVLLRNAIVAGIQAEYNDTADHVQLWFKDKLLAEGFIDDPADYQKLEAAVLEVCGDEAFGQAKLVTAPDQILSDQGRPLISLISLSTVQALSEDWGRPVDPLRFRGNLLFDGGVPWAEFDWLDQTITVGTVLLRIVKRIDRCAATTVNLDTLERDLQIPKLLMQAYGHIDCGVFAEVITPGRIHVGDEITV